ncbi:3123_t:CDS:2 [Funneliformis mosseae]|uniref:3123_t:CDS:1 n=1 Tax=Funneliformis mosseae TaxID=27381 RepID=A0A9N9GZ59_FUNMO|nr:3123_t:CDS:2 [Funneliformis mosseae]
MSAQWNEEQTRMLIDERTTNVGATSSTSSNTPSRRQPSRIPRPIPRAIPSPNRSRPTTPSASRTPSRPVTPSFSQSAETINIFINCIEPDDQE